MAEAEPLVVRELGAAEQSCGHRLAQKKEEEPTRQDTEDVTSGALRQGDTGGDGSQEAGGQSGTVGDVDTQTHAVDEREKAEKSHDEDEEVSQSESWLDSVGEEAVKQARRLTPDFPEALYELLCTLQEGRRLNDQRCSFTLDGGVPRRRCHSEPSANKPAVRVVFSSMTSLQKEEFFELVATAQGRRLDDQRAKLGRRPAPKPKGRSFRGSVKQLSFVRKPAAPPAPAPAPKEDLYNMILTTQAQGRLEDQRSRAPGPMDDEDFFSLLLRVQGGRMDEQRTESPLLLLHAAKLHV